MGRPLPHLPHVVADLLERLVLYRGIDIVGVIAGRGGGGGGALAEGLKWVGPRFGRSEAERTPTSTKHRDAAHRHSTQTQHTVTAHSHSTQHTAHSTQSQRSHST